MKCPNCGYECEKGSNYCPKCGTRLVKTCRNCKRVLKEDEVFCPNCGTDNSKEEKPKTSGFGVFGFILTLLVSACSVWNLLMMRGSFRIWNNGIIRHIPFSYLAIGLLVLIALIVLFAIIFMCTKRKGWVIFEIIFAAVLCLISFGRCGSLFILIGSVMSLADIRK